MSDVPEISYVTALEARPWKPVDEVLHQVIVIDHVTSYEAFFQDILLKNQLCVLGADVTSNWACRRKWVKTDGSPNFTYLMEHFGDSAAPVADCKSEEFCSHPKTEMPVRDFLTYWQHYRSQGHPQEFPCLYLKDWHFTREFPTYHEYKTPLVFCSDWMNEFWDVRKDQPMTDDYRFVYMGPKNSWTPFHADVLHSYSWSANICGKKLWILYPPGEDLKIRDKQGQLVFDLRSLLGCERSLLGSERSLLGSERSLLGSERSLLGSERSPLLSSAVPIMIIQQPGEIVFVPSGWHHQVINLEDTISINHNWMNGCSAHLTWDYLKKRLQAVKREVEDCKNMENWHQHCQVILKADSGMDYIDFYNFVATVASSRMSVLEDNLRTEIPNVVHTVANSKMTVPEDTLMAESLNMYHTTSPCAGSWKSTPKAGEENPGDKECGTTHLSSFNQSYFYHLHHCSRRFCLCLLKGVFVDATDGEQIKCTTEGNKNGSLEDTNHNNCSHWAHCGPNLTLFDLYRSLDIVEDMNSNLEFQIIEQNMENQSKLSVPPLELIDRIETLLRQVTSLISCQPLKSH